MKIKIAIAFLVIFAVSIIGAGGYLFLNNWKKGVEKEKNYLQGRVANLYVENQILKERVSILDRKYKKISNEIKRPEQETVYSKKTNAQALEEIKIKDLVWESLKSQGLDSKFKAITVKKTKTWATANAVPKGTDDNLLFLFKKRDGEWKLLNYGTGLTKSDYAGSPLSIWR